MHVVRRDARHVQVGLDPPQRVILTADPDTLALLDALGGGMVADLRSPDLPEAAWARVVRRLRDADLLLEEGASQRCGGTVAIIDRPIDDGRTAGGLAEVLSGVGIPVVTPQQTPDIVVVCADGPLPRAAVDPWVADGTPHLVIGGTGAPGSWRIGPLVEPGVTACLRCVDAAEATDDPRRPLVVAQLARLAPAPLSPLTRSLGLAWAARDLTAFLSGDRASTWSASVDVHAPVPRPRRWPRHPECGCCWDELPY